MVKAVFQLPNMKRTAGPAGKLAQVVTKQFGTECDMYINSIGLPDYWPNSLLISVGASANVVYYLAHWVCSMVLRCHQRDEGGWRLYMYGLVSCRTSVERLSAAFLASPCLHAM